MVSDFKCKNKSLFSQAGNRQWGEKMARRTQSTLITSTTPRVSVNTNHLLTQTAPQLPHTFCLPCSGTGNTHAPL